MTAPAASTAMLESAYDRVPYEAYPFPHLHPARIAATARLMGYIPPEVRQARVLDIGCGSGGHLIALAGYYPQMRLIGVDLAARQVEQGMQRIRELGLSNVSLHAGDLARGLPASAQAVLDEWGGELDFVLCQGVYYVVPDEVRNVIWKLVREHLAARGIAHVSFNTYPGWKHREVAQDFAQFHAPAGTASPGALENAVREGLNTLTSVLPQTSHPLCAGYAESLRGEAKAAQQAVPGLLFHEFLSGVNRPLYFLQMVAHARAAGLAYLSEAALPSAWPGRFGALSVRLMELAGGDALRMEQYIDFFTACTYRNSLWIHQTNQPQLPQAWSLSALADVSLAADLSLVSDDVGAGRVTLASRAGVEFSVERVHLGAMQEVLINPAKPLWLPAQQWLTAHPASAELMRDCVLHGLVSAWVQPPEHIAGVRRVPDWLRAEALRPASRYLPSAWLEPVWASGEDREHLAGLDAEPAPAMTEHPSRIDERLPYFHRQGWLV